MSTYSNQLQPALQYLLQHVVRVFHPRSSCTTTHISADVKRITLNMSVVFGWKNQTTRYVLPRHWLYEWFSQFHSRGTYSVLSRSTSVMQLETIYGWHRSISPSAELFIHVSSSPPTAPGDVHCLPTVIFDNVMSTRPLDRPTDTATHLHL